MNYHAVVLALPSAALFGISTPAAKALLGTIDPIAASPSNDNSASAKH